MKNTVRSISRKASALHDEIVRIRRKLYMYPERSGDERRTSELVAAKLRSCGLEVRTNVGGYGVVGVLHGAKPGPTIAWRADMDACEMQDTIDKPYRSRIDGVKHVCGHDAHTAIALGVAETLASVRDDLPGTVLFIFQPYEEGCRGAARMIEDGVLESPRPEEIYGLHVTNWGPDQTYLKAGQLTVNFGAALFGRKTIEVTVKVGRNDVILSTEQEVLIHHLKSLNRYTLRCEKPSRNVIDFRVTARDTLFRHDAIHLKASYRFAHISYVDEIDEELNRIINEYRQGNGYDVTVEPLDLVPSVYNDEAASEDAYQYFTGLIGEEAVAIRNELPPHGTDDFALLQHEVSSGLFFFIGIANPAKGITVGMHHPEFDIDEKCLGFAVRTMSTFLFERLSLKANASG